MASSLRSFIIPVLLIGMLLGSCHKSESAGSGAPASTIKVTATTGMIGDLARNIAGSRAAVTDLMGAGVDPHLYKPTQGDLARLGNARLVLYNGLHLEGKMQDILEKLSGRTKVVAVTSNIPKDRLRMPPEFEGNPDPHVWFDVSLWMLAAERIRDALIEIDPAGAEDYRTRAGTMLKSMKDLDEYARAQLSTIPESRRVLITAHDAFGYFGAAYNLEVMGLQGISTASEFGLKDLDRLVEVIVERKVKAVFVESSVPPKSIEALVRGAESRGHPVAIGGTLFSDAMGGAGTPEGTYLGMVRHNVDAITAALK